MTASPIAMRAERRRVPPSSGRGRSARGRPRCAISRRRTRRRSGRGVGAGRQHAIGAPRRAPARTARRAPSRHRVVPALEPPLVGDHALDRGDVSRSREPERKARPDRSPRSASNAPPGAASRRRRLKSQPRTGARAEDGPGRPCSTRCPASSSACRSTEIPTKVPLPAAHAGRRSGHEEQARHPGKLSRRDRLACGAGGE